MRKGQNPSDQCNVDRLRMQDHPHKPPDYRHTDKFIGLILFNSQMVKAGEQKTNTWIDRQMDGHYSAIAKVIWTTMYTCCHTCILEEIIKNVNDS